MSELIDTHCHLTSKPLCDDVDAVIDRAVAAGVTRLITVGTDVADARRAQALAARRREVCFAAGIHPHEAVKARTDDIATLRDVWSDAQCVAAGEMGLDYHYDFSPRDVQQDVFRRQLDAAREAVRPIVVHSREAIDETVRILEDAQFRDHRVVFHCFTGTTDEARVIESFGWRISFTGVVTFKKSTALQAIAAEYPGDRLMLETDSPYLSPEPLRSKRPNEPAYLIHTAGFVASLRGESEDAVREQTTANATQFFSL